MLIQALCDYYDILEKQGAVLPSGYSEENIHFLICLTKEGRIDEILDCRKTEQFMAGKKIKDRKVPVRMLLPQRSWSSGIRANLCDHRPLYIFGLNYEKETLTPYDRTNKAVKSHQAFVEMNLEFIKDVRSPVVDAFRNFLISWDAENETQNQHILGLGKDYPKYKYAFCLAGNPDCLLHEDSEFKKKLAQEHAKKNEQSKDATIAQCAVTGQRKVIGRTHAKIKGIYGGSSNGNVLISYNNPSENSYDNEQSYNSNISEECMMKYTEALNYLLKNGNHKETLDDITVVFWAMNENENNEFLFKQMLFGQQDQMNAEQTEKMLQELLSESEDFNVMEEKLQSIDLIDPDVDFYMVGFKPNISKISVKFFVKKKYADILWNIAQFQREAKASDKSRPVKMWQVKQNLISPKSNNAKVNPALMSKLIEAVLNGRDYPISLLETMVRRVRTDNGPEKISYIRAGIIKACINRRQKKEEIQMALDKTNGSQAYLCGRLFAVLEKLQQEASSFKLNRTIKDAYFASASMNPAMVFPKLIRLSQHHLKKSKYPMYYSKLIEEIVDGLNGEFPKILLLIDQGRFDIGYYHQCNDFWKSKEKSENKEEE